MKGYSTYTDTPVAEFSMEALDRMKVMLEKIPRIPFFVFSPHIPDDLILHGDNIDSLAASAFRSFDVERHRCFLLSKKWEKTVRKFYEPDSSAFL